MCVSGRIVSVDAERHTVPASLLGSSPASSHIAEEAPRSEAGV